MAYPKILWGRLSKHGCDVWDVMLNLRMLRVSRELEIFTS
jgi:hypothetical protein